MAGKRRSADLHSEKYSPIKEARDENSLEEGHGGHGGSSNPTDEYTSMEVSGDTNEVPNRFSNVLKQTSSGSKK